MAMGGRKNPFMANGEKILHIAGKYCKLPGTRM
jgi:hypothetical protein